MQYRDFCGEKVSLLGLGCMRFPTIRETGEIDEAETERLIDIAYEGGINYYDTAYIYHGGKSENVVGKALSKYDREKFYLADKFPVWVASAPEDTLKIFERQLEKCGVTYFDYYLCHSISEAHFRKLEQMGCIDTLMQLKEEERIRRLGFSFHDSPEILEVVVKRYPWDFAQIQYNYLDETLQQAGRQYEILCKANLPVVVMEPVRGGMLAALDPIALKMLNDHDAKRSPASWAIRYAASAGQVATVLSGMSNEAQLRENIATLSDFQPLCQKEYKILRDVASQLIRQIAVPCTGCNYCADCPEGVRISEIFRIYNERVVAENANNYRRAYQALKQEARADRCIACGKCKRHCPQKIDIPDILKKIADLMA